MADFTFVSHKIEAEPPRFNVLSTKMVGKRKKTRLVSSEPEQVWALYFNGQTKSDRDAILSHYKGQFGNTIPFLWKSVPDYIDSTSSYYVRYTEDGYSERIISGIFEIVVKLETAL